MRGKPVGKTVAYGVPGLIPAHAGKTHYRPLRSVRAPAHPRACGENPRQPTKGCAQPGSSPRMRGKLHCVDLPCFRPGLIPAHAGKTFLDTRGRSWSRAHPRACGENQLKNGGTPLEQGSSPRMRGKLHNPRSARFAIGLIPAHAGKTLGHASPETTLVAHPRACGENEDVDVNTTTAAGSSPRMRGKLSQSQMFTRPRRLIPAHAGKTATGNAYIKVERAHPRACGENLLGGSCRMRGGGSSPRMRGKLVSTSIVIAVRGLIPAHAGKTLSP